MAKLRSVVHSDPEILGGTAVFVDTRVPVLGWGGVKNGELLRRAHGRFDAFVTMDSNLEFQHTIPKLSFGVVVLRAKSNRIADLNPSSL